MSKDFAILLAKNIVTENKMPESIVLLARSVIESANDLALSNFGIAMKEFCLQGKRLLS